MKKSFAIVLLLAMALSLAACGEAAPAATPEPTAEPTPAPETLAAEAEELFYKADYTGAFEKLDALETSGITSVQEQLGTSYYYGLGVEADSEEAVAQLTKAADQGDAIAMYLLGNAYASGTGTSRDEAKAKKMYAKFIAVGEADSGENAGSGRIQAYLADCYAYGKGTEKDVDKAAAAAEKAVSADLTVFDMVKLADSYVEGVFTKTDDTTDTAAADTAAAAVDTVAAEGETESETPAIPAEAEELYAKALDSIKALADAGNVKAKTALGDYYFGGYAGIAQDYTKALELYTEAGEKGDADAQAQVGYIYQYGCGVDPDYEKAMEWNNRAAQQGNAQGQAQIGWLYQQGLGVTQNLDEAGRWYTRAADQGNTWAEARLAETEATNPQDLFEAHA